MFQAMKGKGEAFIFLFFYFFISKQMKQEGKASMSKLCHPNAGNDALHKYSS